MAVCVDAWVALHSTEKQVASAHNLWCRIKIPQYGCCRVVVRVTLFVFCSSKGYRSVMHVSIMEVAGIQRICYVPDV